MLRSGGLPENWDNLSLKDKFRLHYQKKDEIGVTPNDIYVAQNIICVGLTWYLAVSMIFTSHIILIPGIWQDNPSMQFFMKLVAWTIFFQFAMNWISTFRTATYHRGGERLSQSFSGWKHCPKCQHEAPPRSHHCPVCKICILKREHHCFFVGKCIGYFNQRRYIVMCFYMTVGCLVGFLLLMLYMNDLQMIFNSNWFYFPPVALWDWIQGTLSTALVYLLLQLYLCIVFGITSAGFFVHEGMMILRGQTSHEAVKLIHLYRKDTAGNIVSVFGKKWFIHFVLPFASHLQGDGIDW